VAFTGGNPSDPLPWAEATGHTPPPEEGAESVAADPLPPTPAPAVCGPDVVAPCVVCKITSETIMTQPLDRARTDIGVGERVTLTFSLGNATWTASAGSLSSATGASVVFTAPGTAQAVTITATGGGCTASIAFAIIAPSDVRMTRIATVHVPAPGAAAGAGTNRIGMDTRIFVLPDTVNFHRVEYLEDEVNNVATGVYACATGTGHFPAVTPFPGTTRVVPRFGTRIDANDSVRSPWCNFGSAQGDGRVTWLIPWRYRVRGRTTYHKFATIPQVCTSALAGAGALRARKARATARANFAGAPTGVW
jgi:hypothetical protein